MLSCQSGANPRVEWLPPRARVADDALIDRSRSGDRAAFDELVERHYTAIFAVARRLAPHPDDAADVAQEVFLAAWRQLPRFGGRAAFRTWLHAICVRQCAGFARASRRRPLAVAPIALPDAVDPRETPLDERVAQRQEDASLHAAIQALSRAQREAVALHYFGGLTCAETALAMGISPGAVMTHLFRARKSLRQSLQWLIDEEASR